MLSQFSWPNFLILFGTFVLIIGTVVYLVRGISKRIRASRNKDESEI